MAAGFLYELGIIMDWATVEFLTHLGGRVLRAKTTRQSPSGTL